MARDGDQVVLAVEGVSKSFGGVVALSGVDLHVERGTVHAVIGPNGSGKTTLMNIISGRLKPDKGAVYLDGKRISGRAEPQVCKLGVARSFQITDIFWNLTVMENLRIAAQAKWKQFNFWSKADALRDAAQTAERVLRAVGLEAKAHLLASQLSHGEQRALDVGIALATGPRLLLLDEPTAGMSLGESEAMMSLVRRLAEHVTVLLVEHKIDLLLNVSDYVTVLHRGSVLARGLPGQIKELPEVVEAYLGHK
ncbi:putative amino-acid import ATP-binding protein YxeO [bacterium HR24]|jgi:branched-chain amino acid transport system ATP-binding protein|nr:putative amino-acid import ATP-binding protein YxeO [bacterium HR24]